MTDFDIVYCPSGQTRSNTTDQIYHVREDCRYYDNGKNMVPHPPESLWSDTRLCKECQRLLESEEP
jgi:hypothetical protein